MLRWPTLLAILQNLGDRSASDLSLAHFIRRATWLARNCAPLFTRPPRCAKTRPFPWRGPLLLFFSPPIPCERGLVSSDCAHRTSTFRACAFCEQGRRPNRQLTLLRRALREHSEPTREPFPVLALCEHRGLTKPSATFSPISWCAGTRTSGRCSGGTARRRRGVWSSAPCTRCRGDQEFRSVEYCGRAVASAWKTCRHCLRALVNLSMRGNSRRRGGVGLPVLHRIRLAREFLFQNHVERRD